MRQWRTSGAYGRSVCRSAAAIAINADLVEEDTKYALSALNEVLQH
jgi:hypothetical protein